MTITRLMPRIGARFGRLKVLQILPNRSIKGEILLKCTCLCGKIYIGKRFSIVSGVTKSCGCLHKETSRLNGLNSAKYTPISMAMFTDIKNSDIAYFLGFISADGGINKESALKICLSRKDESLLKKFTKILNINNPVKRTISQYSWKGERRKSLTCSLTIYSKEFIIQLNKLGITSRKSFTIKFPTYLKPTLIRHFVRGYWDGDGTINISKNKRIKDINVAVCSGSHLFINNLKKWLTSQGIECGKFYNRNSVYSFRISTKGINLYKFYKLLYKKEAICLYRKKNNLKLCIEYLKNSVKSKHSRKFGDIKI